MTGLLAAVTALQRLDDVGLRTLLTERALPYERIDDYFDLAEQLLSPARLNAVLPRQQRTVLELLRSGAQPAADAATAAHAVSLLLLDPATGSAYPPVRDWLETHPEPPAAAEAAVITPPRADPQAADAATSRFNERGYRAITAAAELAVQLAGHAARKRELAGIGNISAVDARRIGEALGLETEQTGLLLALADRAGLLMVRGGSWRPDPAAETAYRSSAPAQRWWRLFTAWSRLLVQPALPPSCTPPAAAEGVEWAERFRRFLEQEYPLGQDWIEPLLTELLGGAELLGITVDGVLTPVGAGALSEAAGHAAAVGHPAAEEAPERLRLLLEQQLPKEIEHVYVQHDLSVIAPGPLRAELDARLRSIADAEGQGLASGYRINADTLARGFAQGLAESEIRRFLEQVSLTGIPQPLDYLLRELGARHGSIRVAAVTGAQAASLGYRSRLRSSDPELLEQLLVDSRLRLLQFTRADDELRSAVNASVVVLTLQEARYPAVADPASTAPAQDAATAPTDGDRDAVLNQLLQRLSQAREDSPQSRQSWFTRQLQSAIRAKLPVTITVQMPDDTLAEFDLEPSAVAGGRIRGRDRRRDSEHTLPLSRVQEVVIRQD